MKRFLIFFILIVFLTVSCAGPSKVKVGWMKPDFSQDQFEKDREECFVQSIEQNQVPDARWIVNCLEEKGYEFNKTVEEGEKPLTTGSIVLDIALLTAISPLIIALSVAYFAMCLGVR
jgi:hypothetical protein